ncbi:MAG: ATPase [Sphingobacteriales bacterium]|nr:MAG: ATPase [Sphingobacteriales bacterium]
MKKIVIIGPESTGKSTLCEQLAQHFNTSWCPEFARQYLISHGTQYTYDDLLTIAQGQLAAEEQMALQINNGLFFIDTNMYVMKVWCEFVFDKCHPWILEQIVNRPYDLYLLCNTDLPWIKDELREYPDLETRNKLFHYYKDLLVNQATPWVEISGNDENRLVQAITAVNKIL